MWDSKASGMPVLKVDICAGRLGEGWVRVGGCCEDLGEGGGNWQRKATGRSLRVSGLVAVLGFRRGWGLQLLVHARTMSWSKEMAGSILLA